LRNSLDKSALTNSSKFDLETSKLKNKNKQTKYAKQFTVKYCGVPFEKKQKLVSPRGGIKQTREYSKTRSLSVLKNSGKLNIYYNSIIMKEKPRGRASSVNRSVLYYIL
jgi:hypothetical protein